MDETADHFPQICNYDRDQEEKGRLVDEPGREAFLWEIPAPAVTAMV
jgi:hypothetical protein